MKIRRGITHCDTIGDIFQNPVLHDFICQWHLIKRDGEGIGMKPKNKRAGKFTPKYYEFIRSIFENRSEMEAFLDYIREQLLINESLYAKIKEEYDTDDFIKMLLSFDEVNNQLSRVTKLTVSGVFQTKVAEIIISAQSQPTYKKNLDDDEEDEYPVFPVYYALEKGIDQGIMPISESGEIICRIADGNKGHIVSVLGEPRIFEVDKLGCNLDPGTKIVQLQGVEVLDTREKVVSRIQLLERIIEYHFRGVGHLTESDEEFYIKSRTEFELRKDREKFIQNSDIRNKLFGGALQETKDTLEKLLKNMGKKPKKLELVKEAD